MPFSKKPRRRYDPHAEGHGPNPYTTAGTLVYSWFEQAAMRKLGHATAERASPRKRRTRRHPTTHVGFRTRQNRLGSVITRNGITMAACDPAGSKPAQRRLRQKLVQHPSVVARFANHPTRAQVDEAIAVAEKPGLLDPLRKIFGETKAKRDARIKRERRATA